MILHQPIRPTLTQSLSIVPLPCSLEPSPDDPPLSDPLKPFEGSEVQIVSEPNSTTIEEAKAPVSPLTPLSPMTAQRLYKQAGTKPIQKLESDRMRAKQENSAAQVEIAMKAAEMQALDQKVVELEQKLKEVTEEVNQRRVTEEKLKVTIKEKQQELARLAQLKEEENKLAESLTSLKAQYFEKYSALSLVSIELGNMERVHDSKTGELVSYEAEVGKLTGDIDFTQTEIIRVKAKIAEKKFQLTSEVELMQEELRLKEKDAGPNTLESVFKLVQANMDALIQQGTKDTDLVGRFSEQFIKVSTLEKQYRVMRLKNAEEIAKLRLKAEIELFETDKNTSRMINDVEAQLDPEIVYLKGKLNEVKEMRESSNSASEEQRLLLEHSSRYEKSIKFYRRQVEDLEYLCKLDEEELKTKQMQLENYEIEIERYKKQLGKKRNV
mmetsp:Transcript_32905/g.57524  ORF Transcript_32905/g.57524 Transcript_32905/m.57524 type:complete len:439 (+) Transcript_32905:152-1468(+)